MQEHTSGYEELSTWYSSLMAEPAASANTGTKRRSYSLEMKISVIEESKHSSKKKASEMFVIDWCKEEKIRDEFILRSAKRCRLLGAGQKPAARNLEEINGS